MLVEDVNQESTRVIDGEVPDWTPADEKRIRRRIVRTLSLFIVFSLTLNQGLPHHTNSLRFISSVLH